jgi:hypothetical protein
MDSTNTGLSLRLDNRDFQTVMRPKLDCYAFFNWIVYCYMGLFAWRMILGGF